MTQIDDFRALIDRSKRFLISSEMQAGKGFYDLAVFSLEQALQLFLKALLIKHGVEYPRIHGIRKLLKMLEKVSGFNVISRLLERYSFELGVLEDAYITSRYIPREYTREDYERLREAVEEIINGLGGYNG